MPNRWTFKIKPIKQLLDRYIDQENLWIDPFAGKNSPAKITNDLDVSLNTTYDIDALTFLKGYGDNSVCGILYDPPFSPAQADWCYVGTNLYKRNTEFWKYMSSCRKEIARISEANGIVICFGFNSGGIGKKYGFNIEEILLVPHGINRNDTIVTVERKLEKNSGRRQVNHEPVYHYREFT